MISQCDSECLCIVPQPDIGQWAIFHGEVDEEGVVFLTQQIVVMPHENEVVELAKNIGDGLEVPVYEVIPGVAAELLQEPLTGQ